MSISTFERNASIAEMAVEIDRRGAVIEKLEAENTRLRMTKRAIVDEVLDLLTAHELYRYRPKAFDGFIAYARENLERKPNE